jgi:hypothetical protein
MADLLPHLHEYAVETAGGRSSVLLQVNSQTGHLHPTSAFGLDYLPTSPWLTETEAARVARQAMDVDAPAWLHDLPEHFPELAERLGTRHAVCVPLTGLDGILGVIVLGMDGESPVAEITARLAPVADAFVLALERRRLQRDADLQRELRALMHDFSERVSATLALRAGLEIFCDGATRLFGANATQVWLHDRNAHELVLEACSEAAPPPHATRIPTTATDHPAAAALRAERPRIELGDGIEATPTVAVGLLGRRRALGTLVFEVMRVEPGEESDILARVEEVGRQLAAAIENTQLLEQVLRQTRG